MRGSVGVGWVPSYDVNPPPRNAESQRCVALMERAGLKGTTFTWSVCDHVNVFLRGARLATAPTATAFNAGLQRLGFTELATVLQGRYGGGRRDGAGAAAFLTFDAGCTCYKYSSKPYVV
jgi:hypothetical protein